MSRAILSFLQKKAYWLFWMRFSSSKATCCHSDAAVETSLEESCLNPDNVKTRFAKRFTLSVIGQIYAQPLVVSNIQIQGKSRNALYVATMENWVYAFDADGDSRDSDGIPQPLWSTHLGPP